MSEKIVATFTLPRDTPENAARELKNREVDLEWAVPLRMVRRLLARRSMRKDGWTL